MCVCVYVCIMCVYVCMHALCVCVCVHYLQCSGCERLSTRWSMVQGVVRGNFAGRGVPLDPQTRMTGFTPPLALCYEVRADYGCLLHRLPGSRQSPPVVLPMCLRLEVAEDLMAAIIASHNAARHRNVAGITHVERCTTPHGSYSWSDRCE